MIFSSDYLERTSCGPLYSHHYEKIIRLAGTVSRDLPSPQIRDPVLIPLIEARDDASREHAIERVLVENAAPTIEMVLARFTRSEGALRRDDVADVAATVSLRLLKKLQAIENGDDEPIQDFEGYVATITYNAVHDYLRQRFPERTRLKNRIRRLLTNDELFALWSTPREMAGGFRSWRGRADLRSFTVDRAGASPAMLDRDQPQVAVAEVFRRAGGPLALETLVRVVAGLWNVTESRVDSADESIVAAVPNHATKYETRQFLEVLWKEIQLLPRKQRAALLLNLRDADGVNAVALFILVGVARFSEVADAIGVGVDELAAMWEALPIDDLTIAARLNMTRPQVITLRRSARERLARRTVMFQSHERRR
jgi:RNA polymerase sigma factor (sigma-70 family)